MVRVLLLSAMAALATAAVWQDNCDGDWAKCRANTIKAIFNATTTPSRDPDYTIPYPDYRMKGLPGPGAGTGVGDVEWENNLTVSLLCLSEKERTSDDRERVSDRGPLPSPALLPHPPAGHCSSRCWRCAAA